MLKSTLDLINQINPFEEVEAHCDIPCGIYDPHHALVACLTAIRMTDLIIAHKNQASTVEWLNEVSRYVAEKEKHAEIVKHEIRVIWGDFYKAPQFEKYPNLHELTHGIMLLGSKVRQEVNKDAALQLLDKLNEFAEIFWAIKGVETYRATSPYKPELKVVYPKLG